MHKHSLSRAESMADSQQKARRRFLTLPAPGTRPLTIVSGITIGGEVFGSFDSALAELTSVLQEAKTFFHFDGDIVAERGNGPDGRLVTLAGADSIEAIAGSILSNYVICELAGKSEDDIPRQFPIPRKLIDSLLHRDATRLALPQIDAYYRRPVFDTDFCLRGNGYHEDIATLVHAIDVNVEPLGDIPNPSLAVRERLPPHIRRLLQDYCLKTDADLVNMLSVLLTGLLANHFIDAPKPVFLFDGNQPNLGKTLFAICVSEILDGISPILNRFTTDETELEKQLVASARARHRSLIIIDNAKLRGGEIINSPTIESMSGSPRVSGRILTTSDNFERPNDLTWIITMNKVKVSPDLNSRGVAIQFYYEGLPLDRDFGGRNPQDYAREYRLEILAELAGLVDRWTQAGRPPGTRPHRCRQWAAIIGGIFEINGFPEFLTNQAAASEEFATEADDLMALAEIVFRNEKGPFVDDAQNGPIADGLIAARALPASGWVPFFIEAHIDAEKIKSMKSDRAKSTQVGKMLVSYIGRSVLVETKKGTHRTTLRMVAGRANTKSYYLETLLESVPDAEQQDSSRAESKAAPKRKGLVRPKVKVVAESKVASTMMAKPKFKIRVKSKSPTAPPKSDSGCDDLENQE